MTTVKQMNLVEFKSFITSDGWDRRIDIALNDELEGGYQLGYAEITSTKENVTISYTEPFRYPHDSEDISEDIEFTGIPDEYPSTLLTINGLEVLRISEDFDWERAEYEEVERCLREFGSGFVETYLNEVADSIMQRGTS